MFLVSTCVYGIMNHVATLSSFIYYNLSFSIGCAIVVIDFRLL